MAGEQHAHLSWSEGVRDGVSQLRIAVPIVCFIAASIDEFRRPMLLD